MANINVDGILFVCVPLAEADFKNVAAVYVIICLVRGKGWKVIDVGQAGKLGNRIDYHDREECWRENCEGEVWVCVHLMPTDEYSKEDRLELENSIRQKRDLPCGKR